MSERERAYLRPMQAAAITHPQDAGEDDWNTGEKPTNSQDQSLDSNQRDRRHPLLQFELQRPAAAITGNGPNGNKGQKERCSDFIGTEGWGDDAIERKQRIGKSRRGPTLSACFRVGSDGFDKSHSDKRAYQSEHDPPRARRHELAPLLLQKPGPGAAM